MAATLNKDGTPRKTGSGKTKGAGCFAKIKWEQLREFVQDDENILVSRVWLRSVGALNQKKGSKKKLQSHTPTPRTKPAGETTYNHSSAKQSHSNAKEALIKSPDINNLEDDEYDPPPLFASIGEIQKY
jgi:hypothetical protein